MYVIYTSGSTGRPKGVVVTHANVDRLLTSTDPWLDLRPDDVWTLFHSYAFDFAVWELWGALVHGGRLVIVPSAVSRSPEDFHRLLVDERVTVLNQTPSAFRQLLWAEEAGASRGEDDLALRTVIFGGEALDLASLEPWFARHGDERPRLFNMYGITETTVHVTFRPIGRGDVERGSVIGRPLPDLAVYVLDGDLEPVPVGVPGELYVAGEGLVLGYLGRPELTAERFLPNPFGGLPSGEPGARGPSSSQLGARLYRSGDRVRRLADGDLEYLGRKVDRAALPAPSAASLYDPPAAAPATAVEALLAGIWRQVLGREQVGRGESFFRLGGDSILSLQVVSRARAAGLVITPAQIFELQTIAAVAAAAVPLVAAEAEQGPVVGAVPLTPIQRYFLASGAVEPHHFNQSLLLATAEPLAGAPLAAAAAALAVHHDALRLRFHCESGEWHQEIAPPGGPAPYREIDLSALPRERRRSAVERAAAALQAGFELARGPLFLAARFILVPGNEDRLFLVAHHLAIDGVSWRVLLEDLEAAYERLAAGRPPDLPAKTTSWKRWAEALAERARSTEVRAELPYWLATASAPALPLPGHPGGADAVGVTAAVEVFEVELGAETTAALLGAAAVPYRTRIDDLLLAALARALAAGAMDGEITVRLDLEGHGREAIAADLDLSRTVGWFTALYPAALTLPADAGVGETIIAVKEQLRAIPRRGLGYGLLRYLSPPSPTSTSAPSPTSGAARLAELPAPDVAFNYLGQLDASLGRSSRWRLIDEPTGPGQSPRARPRHRLEVNAWVLGGRLHAGWAYDTASCERPAIERLGRRFAAELAGVVAHCASRAAGAYTPSDFPLARLEQAALDRLLGRGAALDRAVEDVYPLAPLQEGMLVEALRAPRAELYFEQLACTLAGDLEVTAFQHAWQAALDRHPALRTAFVWQGLPRPLQIVRRGAALPWTIEDWRGVPGGEREARLEAWLADDRARGFELARAPLQRAALLRMGEHEHRFVWSFHHLLLDGWCLALVFREVLAQYQALVAGREARRPPARPYRDLVAWIEGQDPQAAEGYFRRALAGFTATTPLPIDRPLALPPAAPPPPRWEERMLPPALVEGLERLARERDLTLNTLVQGAWALLLSRSADEEDVVFGAVVAGRPAELPGVESIVGLFINTLPVRAMIEPAAPLAGWLRRLQEAQLELRRHEHASLVQIQRWSELPAGEPLFASFVAFENYPVDAALAEEPTGVDVRDVVFADRTGYPLSLAAMPGRGRGELALRLAYDHRADGTTVERLLQRLENLLAGFMASPEGRLDQLPWLTAAEEDQLRREWGEGIAVGRLAAAALVESIAERLGIGAAGAELRLRVLGRDLRPAPAGARGELFLSGAGLAGLELPPASFVPAPGGERLLRTGDRVRRSVDGHLELVGPATPRAELPGGSIVAPATHAERVLAGIWRELLGRREVSVGDSFLRLGGDSILGLQMVVRARAAGLAITPAQVFELQTVAALAAVAVPLGGASGEAHEADQARDADSPELLAELPYWLATVAAPVQELPRDRHAEEASLSSSLVVDLDPALAAPRLAAAAAAYRARPDELLITALAQALQSESSAVSLRFDLVVQGREDIAADFDVPRPVGSLAMWYPALVTLSSGAEPGEAIVAVKEQLRAIPGDGSGYLLLRDRSSAPEAARLAELPAPEIAFRYLGALGADASPFAGQRAPGRRLEVDAWMADGRLRTAWTYSAAHLEGAAVELLSRRFAAALAVLIAHGAGPEAGAYTPADFPLAHLDAGGARPPVRPRRGAGPQRRGRLSADAAPGGNALRSSPRSRGGPVLRAPRLHPRRRPRVQLRGRSFPARLAGRGRPPSGPAHGLRVGGAVEPGPDRASRRRDPLDLRGLARRAGRRARRPSGRLAGRRPRSRLRSRPRASPARRPVAARRARAPLRLELPSPAARRLVLRPDLPRGLRPLCGGAGWTADAAAAGASLPRPPRLARAAGCERRRGLLPPCPRGIRGADPAAARPPGSAAARRGGTPGGPRDLAVAGGDRRPRAPGAPARADSQHPGAGRLGAAPRARRGRGRHRLRQCRLRTPGGAPRRREHRRSLHQHAAGARDRRAGGVRRRLAPPSPGGSGRAAAS